MNRLYAQNHVFDIVHDESVKVYLHMYNGNVQQNPLCVESCVTKEFSISPRFSPTIFDPDANSVLLRAHLCTAVDSMCRKSCVRNCSREREGLYNGNVQQNHLCAAASCHQESSHFSPVLGYDFLSRCKFSTPTIIAHFCTAVLINLTRELPISPWFSPTVFYRDVNSRLLRARLCTAVDSMRRNPCVFEIVQETVKVCTTGMSSRILYAQHPVTKNHHIYLPGSRLRLFIAMKIQYSYSTPLYSGINRLRAQNSVFEIVHDKSVKVYLHSVHTTGMFSRTLCVESCVTKEFPISPRFSPTIFYPDEHTFVQQQ